VEALLTPSCVACRENLIIDQFHAHLIRLAPCWVNAMGLYALYISRDLEGSLTNILKGFNIAPIFKHVFGQLSYVGSTWTASRGRRLLLNSDDAAAVFRAWRHSIPSLCCAIGV